MEMWRGPRTPFRRLTVVGGERRASLYGHLHAWKDAQYALDTRLSGLKSQSGHSGEKRNVSSRNKPSIVKLGISLSAE
jgi:hypothetical protein